MTLHREELCVAITGLVLTLDELEFADMVVVVESAEDQAAIAESVFAPLVKALLKVFVAAL